MPELQQIEISIFPEYGDSYFWVRRPVGESQGSDDNAHSQRAFAGFRISPALLADFATWYQEFAQAEYVFPLGIASLDWPNYHRRGMDLTRRLKNEIGDAARVIYKKPHEDPNCELQPAVEIMPDGSSFEVSRENNYHRFAWLPRLIYSGGQTGVDRAALFWAASHRIPHTGWCPRGRRAEDGCIPIYYQLKETESADYKQRTRQNVLDAEGTLILNIGEIEGGTEKTISYASAMKRPCLVVNLDAGLRPILVGKVIDWLRNNLVERLNIAGPRESKRPGIYDRSLGFLNEIIDIAFDNGIPE